jgi:SpoVK/Ycf46/Vps4 family AAA+-type ATPase
MNGRKSARASEKERKRETDGRAWGGQAPSIVFIDEIDAVGTKRYDSTSGGEREIQRTMLELLNQVPHP